MNIAQLMFVASIVEACRATARVSVLDSRTGQVLEGNARYIVAPDHEGAPSEVTMDCRVRITLQGGGEAFVRLGNIPSDGFYVH